MHRRHDELLDARSQADVLLGPGNLLTALAGGLASDDPEEQFDLASFQLPTDLPVSVPANLMVAGQRTCNGSWLKRMLI